MIQVGGSKPFFIASDLHLGAVPDANERRFRRFLDHAAAESSGLLINGDLFEFGVAYRSVVPRKHVRVLAKLTEMVEENFPVYFMAGNHDHLEWGGRVMEEDVGLTILPDPVVLDISGRRALVTHGDVVGEGAGWDRRARRIARSRAPPCTSVLRAPRVPRIDPLAPSGLDRAHSTVHDLDAPPGAAPRGWRRRRAQASSAPDRGLGARDAAE